MLDRLIEQYGRRLYGLCRTLCAADFSADDLYQETWLRVCSRMEQYDSSRPFEPWLTGICVNLYRDWLRRRSFSRIFDGFASTADKDAVMDAVPSPQTEDYSYLHSAIDRLPEKLRTAVILHYFHDMKLDQTAAALGVPVGTVKSRLSQARDKLRKELTDESDLRF